LHTKNPRISVQLLINWVDMMTRSDKAARNDQDIYERIFAAVLDRRLRPGAHLRETELAQMFGVSRTTVRQALAKLIEVGIVEMRPNRGAAIAAPTRRQALEVFQLRSIIEPTIASCLAQQCSLKQIGRLRAHVEQEKRALATDDEGALIRMTGEFHLVLAAMWGNNQVDAILRKLEALTCLSMLTYARSGASSCLPDEHEEILDAISSGNGEKARALMETHLARVLADLDLEIHPSAQQPLAVLLGFNAKSTGVKRRASRPST
jgi:DNA-binding GntR family transcriptional regulator